MTELIISALLAGARFFFTQISDKSDEKKKIAALITQWMKTMRKEFQASTEIAEEFERLWAEKKPWEESQ